MCGLQTEGPEPATLFQLPLDCGFPQAKSHVHMKLIAEMVLETPKPKFTANVNLPSTLRVFSKSHLLRLLALSAGRYSLGFKIPNGF